MHDCDFDVYHLIFRTDVENKIDTKIGNSCFCALVSDYRFMMLLAVFVYLYGIIHCDDGRKLSLSAEWFPTTYKFMYLTVEGEGVGG